MLAHAQHFTIKSTIVVRNALITLPGQWHQPPLTYLWIITPVISYTTPRRIKMSPGLKHSLEASFALPPGRCCEGPAPPPPSAPSCSQALKAPLATFPRSSSPAATPGLGFCGMELLRAGGAQVEAPPWLCGQPSFHRGPVPQLGNV